MLISGEVISELERETLFNFFQSGICTLNWPWHFQQIDKYHVKGSMDHSLFVKKIYPTKKNLLSAKSGGHFLFSIHLVSIFFICKLEFTLYNSNDDFFFRIIKNSRDYKHVKWFFMCLGDKSVFFFVLIIRLIKQNNGGGDGGTKNILNLIIYR